MKPQLRLLEDFRKRVRPAEAFQLRTTTMRRGCKVGGNISYILNVTGSFKSLSFANVKSSRLSLSMSMVVDEMRAVTAILGAS